MGQTDFASGGKPYCGNGYEKEVFAREEDKGRLESISKPGLGGIWGTASALSVKRPSGDSPQIN